MMCWLPIWRPVALRGKKLSELENERVTTLEWRCEVFCLEKRFLGLE